MPVHPSEEHTNDNITEMVAKNPSSTTESTASDHHHHKDSVKATAQDFQANPGPAIPQTMDDLPPKASKEELKARSEELNK
ncbi:MAG: hypothetical protein M1812_005134 [Candelaria pacifica]|nr:MAG: hypothetical protein M1812_005134 [Candelaria pacifica]